MKSENEKKATTRMERNAKLNGYDRDKKMSSSNKTNTITSSETKANKVIKNTNAKSRVERNSDTNLNKNDKNITAKAKSNQTISKSKDDVKDNAINRSEKKDSLKEITITKDLNKTKSNDISSANTLKEAREKLNKEPIKVEEKPKEKVLENKDKISEEKITFDKTKKKKKRKLRLKPWVWLVLIFISLGVLSVALLNIFVWNKDNAQMSDIIEDIDKQAEVTEVTDAGEEVNPPENKEDPYWSYIHLPLINVDFSELLKTNNQTVGFIKVNGTNINYPVVQASDNDFYLNHTFDKSSNGGGWVFLDYRNDINNLNHNTIIYAHGRQNTTMFGSLKNIIKNNWYQNTDNYVVNLSTPKENTLWQVFSVYTIPTETYYLTTNFGSKESHQKFLDTMKERSVYDFKTTLNTSDRILTLSTCLNDDVKVVLHAKLIKKQVR